MIKQQLTSTQKEIFTNRFEEIINRGPEKVKRTWNGKIEWNRDLPVFNNSVHLHLTGKSAHDYEELIKNLNSRTL